MLDSIYSIVREAEDNFLNGTTKLGKYVDWSMHETIERVDAYLNSVHVSGSTDSLGREKPFFNIVSAAVNIWYRATDIDRKDIRILPDKIENTGAAFIATVLLQEWMKKVHFGAFLNQWGRALARYGSAVVKFVEKDGELIPSVIPWNRFIADPVDFTAIPCIEKFYKTPAQLRKMNEYDQDVVSSLIDSQASRKTLDGNQKDNADNFIEIYEVHGEMDARLLEDEPKDVEGKDIKYVQQMHVVSYVYSSETKEYKDYTLYRGREAKNPYMITHLIEEDGRTLSIGAVEYLFDAQWMQNHTVKNIKDTLDLASKLIFQTSDTNFAGRNVLSAIETGDIFVHKTNEPLTRLANDKPDVSALMNYRQMWANLGQEVTSTPDAARGITPPSGTALGTVQITTAQGLSLFEIMTENKGQDIEKMMRYHVLPHLIKKMDNKDEVVAILDEQGIAEIDAMYVPNVAKKLYNKEAKTAILSGSVPSPYQADIAEGAVRESLAQMGNKRSFKPSDLDDKTWKEALKDLEWEVSVEVTNEGADKLAVMQTLTNVLQTIASNPMILRDPNAKMVFSAILTETGRISPLQLSTTASQPSPMSAQAPPPGVEGVTAQLPG